jgi:hypothetical protein
MEEFSPKWISWIESIISDGSVVVNVNDDVGSFFQIKKRPSTRGSFISITF